MIFQNQIGDKLLMVAIITGSILVMQYLLSRVRKVRS